MTTASWTGFVDHSGDVGFRLWATELGGAAGQLQAIGLVQTADTGQINLVTVTRPGVNTAGGYQIWRFADSTLYMKWEFGTGAAATTPQMWMTVGTGSNGSGTITGQTSTRSVFGPQAAPISTVTNYPSYICRIADAFSLSWKEGGFSNGAQGNVTVGKTVDGAGAATTTGFAVIRYNGGNRSIQGVRIVSTATTYTDDAKGVGVFPGDPTNSVVQGTSNTQAYQIAFNVPEVVPFAWACGVILSEAPINTTFSVAMVGSTSHTYRSPGQVGNTVYAGGYAVLSHGIASIYE